MDATQAGVVDPGTTTVERGAVAPEPRAEAASTGAPTIVEPHRPAYVRRPSDVLRLVIGLSFLLIGLLVALLAQNAITAFQRNVFAFFGDLGHSQRTALRDAVAVFVYVIVVVAILVLIFLRRWRALGYLVLANLAASNLGELAARGVHHLEPKSFEAKATFALGPIADRFSDAGAMAGTVAIVTVMAPWMNRTWRRLAWTALLLVALARLVASSALPAGLFFDAALGWVVGTIVLLAFGAPNPNATGAAIAAALRDAGLPLARLKPAAVDARASVPWFVETVDGQRLFVKVLGAGQRDADLLFRLYRFIRFRDTGDEAPFASVRRSVEHEMLLDLAARDVGARTPRVRTVAGVEAPGGAVLLASDRIEGRGLDEVDASVLTDDVLRDLWQQVRILRENKIAHRDLRLANVFLDDEGRTWIIDFGFGAIAAEEHALDDDVAGLLASTALVVGARRAVAIACEVMGHEAVGEALPRLQPDALSGATRTALRQPEHEDLLADLRSTAQQASGLEALQLERLQRIRIRTVLLFLGLGLAVFLLYPQLANVDTMFDRVRHARWGWGVVALLASVGTYIGATWSMMGSVPGRLRFRPTFEAQVASSFANRVTPAQVGGYAVNVRYLQRVGVDTPVAVTADALNLLGGTIVHVGLLFVFLIWAQAKGVDPVHVPEAAKFLYVSIALVIGAAAVMGLPVGRRVMARRIWPALKRGAHGLMEVARRPAKLALLFGGSAVVTLSYIVSLAASVYAFGGHLSFAEVGVAYLTASVIVSIVPTPGGIGAAEAAYSAALTIFGLDKSVALSVVFLFRICTFWLPIIPGWLTFRAEQRRGER